MSLLQPPSAPRLPDAPQGPQWGYQSGLLNVLRLFFAHIVRTLQTLLGPGGGRYLDSPNGVFYRITDQMLAAPGVGVPVEFEGAYTERLVRVEDGTKLRVLADGMYRVEFVGNFLSSSGADQSVYLWLEINGAAVPYSGRMVTCPAGAQLQVGLSTLFEFRQDDYLEVFWAAGTTDIELCALAPAAPHPGVPAATCTLVLASALP